ncbi:ribonuclease R [Blattabacterium cuenoti]|uniref:ribonuclease R n=1 Tax=Blattabacterium cuenoti TaxID=1653831 RepID=UPI00163C0BF5|nr:ribonuclease R [Blattabacterium cuenoti]
MKSEKKNKKKHNNHHNHFTTGYINFTKNGYAFVKIEKFQKDIFIPKNKTNRALEGDLVRIKFNEKYRNKRGIKMEGEVLKIVKRKTKKFIGILKIKSYSKYGLVVIYNKSIHVDIFIPINDSIKHHHNNKVLVKIISWPKKLKNPLGKIIKIFGKSGEYTTEMFSLLEEYEISYEFSNKIKSEIEKIYSETKKISFFNGNLRKDMRDINTFTIDPINAKDFDDALSIRKLDNNVWEIGIHISDVSHYIKEGSLIDKEAYSRATSIYFTGKVIPMLPEILSNQLFSLQPKKERLSFSYIFNINNRGKILKNWFGKTIIKSNRKFTYEEVQQIIDKKKGDFHEEINDLFFFSKILTRKRLKNGAIYLDRIEVKFNLDNENNPISLDLEKNNDAHKLIEEFMLLANNKISEFVSLNFKEKSSNRIFIYRVHDKPDFQKIFFIKKIIEPLGYFLDSNNLKKSINSLLKKIKGKPEQNMIENLILRAMSKAKYTTKNIGHYGLSFFYYTHFTSPIRRYSDIIAHRLLYYYLLNDDNYLNNNADNKTAVYRLKNMDFYEKQSLHCSHKERLAIDVEREFLKYIQIKYIKNFLGKEFYGIITGFTDWSVYVDILLFQTEGMVKLRDIKEDSYILNSKNYSIIGKKKRKIYQLGDKVKVKLMDINMEKKQIILSWMGNNMKN